MFKNYLTVCAKPGHIYDPEIPFLGTFLGIFSKYYTLAKNIMFITIVVIIVPKRRNI